MSTPITKAQWKAFSLQQQLVQYKLLQDIYKTYNLGTYDARNSYHVLYQGFSKGYSKYPHNIDDNFELRQSNNIPGLFGVFAKRKIPR